MTSFVSCFGGLLDGGLGFCRGMGGVLWDLILLWLPFHSFFCGVWCWFSLDGSAAFFSVFPDGVGEFLVVLLQHSPEGWLNYLLFLRLLFLVFLGCKALDDKRVPQLSVFISWCAGFRCWFPRSFEKMVHSICLRIFLLLVNF